MRRIGVLITVLCFIAAGSVFAEEKGSKMHTESLQTVKGEVIDVSCYVAHGARGPGHKQCAIDCMKAGQPAGILEEGTGKVYVAAKEEGHLVNPNTELIPYAAKTVEVKGVVHERGGVATIDVREIKEAGGSSAMQEKKGSGTMHDKNGHGMMERKGSGY